MAIITQLQDETLNPSGGRVKITHSNRLQRIAEEYRVKQRILESREEGYTMKRAVEEGICTEYQWRKYAHTSEISDRLNAYCMAQQFQDIKDLRVG